MAFIDTDHRLIAILRGLVPSETEGIVLALLEAGFRAIEIPLNSPDPFASIRIAVEVADRFAPGACLIGAGTVLNVAEVEQVGAIGGKLIVSPNVNPDVIAATRAGGLHSYPGVFTPTEAHLAVASGATGLKFFPAALLGPSGIKSIGAILPEDTKTYAVGGVVAFEFADYLFAGATGFGLGSNLYKPGADSDSVRKKAEQSIEAFDRALKTQE